MKSFERLSEKEDLVKECTKRSNSENLNKRNKLARNSSGWSRNPEVALAQASLVEAGYDIGPFGIDGRAGDNTAKAVKQFQSAIGLKCTGKLDLDTRKALEQITAVGLNARQIMLKGMESIEQTKLKSPENKLKQKTSENKTVLYQIKVGLGNIISDLVKKDDTKSIASKPELKDVKQIDASVLSTRKEKFEYIFGTGGNYYETEKEAFSHMKTITIDIWRYNIETKSKYSATIKLTVHEKLSDVVQKIFKEIYNDPEQFPIDPATTGAYCWRNTPNFPNHQNGLAIDINWDANFMKQNGKIIAGKEWSP